MSPFKSPRMPPRSDRTAAGMAYYTTETAKNGTSIVHRYSMILPGGTFAGYVAVQVPENAAKIRSDRGGNGLLHHRNRQERHQHRTPIFDDPAGRHLRRLCRRSSPRECRQDQIGPRREWPITPPKPPRTAPASYTDIR